LQNGSNIALRQAIVRSQVGELEVLHRNVDALSGDILNLARRRLRYFFAILTKTDSRVLLGHACVYPFGNWDLGGPGVKCCRSGRLKNAQQYPDRNLKTPHRVFADGDHAISYHPLLSPRSPVAG